MDYQVQIFQFEEGSAKGQWAVWYKDEDGDVLEEYGFETFEEVSRFIEGNVLSS